MTNHVACTTENVTTNIDTIRSMGWCDEVTEWAGEPWTIDLIVEYANEYGRMLYVLLLPTRP